MSFESIKMEITGASRESRIGIRISGLNGVEISAEDGQKMLNRRKPTDNVWCTPRKEDDVCVFESGVQNGVVVGDIVCHILNENIKTDDVKYPRPSHADFVGRLTGADVNGGGKFSGRMTALTCILGGIAKGILLKYGIRVNAYISKIGDIQLGSYEGNSVELFGVDEKLADKLESSSFPVLNEENKEKAIQYILDAKEKGDSVGGEVQCVISGLKEGLIGGPLYDGLEGIISYSIYGVPAVKGVVFGSGARTSTLGSIFNDPLYVNNGKVRTKTNHNGGINGGISNGMPITLTAYVKPTPSISKEQQTVDLETMTNVTMTLHGRNDACIVPRIIPCIESAVCIALLDKMLSSDLIVTKNDSIDFYRNKIDGIDEGIKNLFLKRINAVVSIGLIKQIHGTPVADEKREAEILERVTEGVSGKDKEDLIKLYKAIFSISRDIQK